MPCFFLSPWGRYIGGAKVPQFLTIFWSSYFNEAWHAISKFPVTIFKRVYLYLFTMFLSGIKFILSEKQQILSQTNYFGHKLNTNFHTWNKFRHIWNKCFHKRKIFCQGWILFANFELNFVLCEKIVVKNEIIIFRSKISFFTIETD